MRVVHSDPRKDGGKKPRRPENEETGEHFRNEGSPSTDLGVGGTWCGGSAD